MIMRMVMGKQDTRNITFICMNDLKYFTFGKQIVQLTHSPINNTTKRD